MDMHHDNSSSSTMSDTSYDNRYILTSSTQPPRMNMPSPDKARTIRYLSHQPTENFRAKWELTLFADNSQDVGDDTVDSMNSGKQSTSENSQRHHPNLSMTQHHHHTSQLQALSSSFTVSEKLILDDVGADINNTTQGYAIGTFCDVDVLLPDYLTVDEHYDPTCSWVDQIYYEDEEADVTMVEDGDNDEGDDDGVENRPPRQWRRRQRKDEGSPKMKTYCSSLSVHRPPLQEIILESEDSPQRKKLVMLNKKQSFRLMRSLSPPSTARGRHRSASMTD
ncbi:hypothetical protein BX666DRAFT_2026811 [Dichotomocladium elegans]|nr:hypothetical protein BX666DRAFT_2026811 [Dichotomocladium elegans]